MQRIDLEIEAVQISIYTNIVQSILNEHKQLSLNKTMVFAYIIKNEKYRGASIYTAGNTQDIVCKALSLMSGEYVEFCRSVGFILKAIHLLIQKEFVAFDGEFLSSKNEISIGKTVYPETPFLRLAIEKSKSMTDRQFLKEVTANV